MEQHLERQAGVQKVQVSLNDGSVEITPKSDGHIDPIELLKATYDSGVSVAEMKITARGKITKDSSGVLVLNITPSEYFKIQPDTLSTQLESIAGSDHEVVIRGLLYKKAPGQKKKTLPPELNLTILEVRQQ